MLEEHLLQMDSDLNTPECIFAKRVRTIIQPVEQRPCLGTSCDSETSQKMFKVQGQGYLSKLQN